MSVISSKGLGAIRAKIGPTSNVDKIVFKMYSQYHRHKQNSWFCKEIREDNFRFWWRRVHEDASQGMYMSKIEIFFFIA
jgi:hypothetical protein